MKKKVGTPFSGLKEKIDLTPLKSQLELDLTILVRNVDGICIMIFYMPITLIEIGKIIVVKIYYCYVQLVIKLNIT